MAARTKVLIGAAALLLGSVTACGTADEPPTGETSASPTQESSSETSPPDEPASSASPSETGSDDAATGCAPTDEDVPSGADTGPTADLDGDGEADELWLADVDDTRVLGVRTASGAVFSTEFTSGAPQAASALGQVLGDGSAIVLLDTGREVPLYAVIDCALVPTQNDEGEQYSFDKGFTGYGTGVGCEEEDDGGLALVGYLAEVEGESATVTTTRIDLGDGGATASNGEATEAEGLDADDPVVDAATSVTCGDAEPVSEPQG